LCFFGSLQRVRVLSDPLAPLQADEIFDVRWFGGSATASGSNAAGDSTKFHLTYHNRHYYANGSNVDHPTDASTQRYEDRKVCVFDCR
jgi:hypothetical protein